MLKIDARNLETITILSLQGQIVAGETEILRNAVWSLTNKSAVILDFARVTTVDAHGLGVLLQLREQTQAKAMQFELMNISKPLSKVLEMTRLDSVFQIVSNVEFFPAVLQPRTRTALRTCA